MFHKNYVLSCKKYISPQIIYSHHKNDHLPHTYQCCTRIMIISHYLYFLKDNASCWSITDQLILMFLVRCSLAVVLRNFLSDSQLRKSKSIIVNKPSWCILLQYNCVDVDPTSLSFRRTIYVAVGLNWTSTAFPWKMMETPFQTTPSSSRGLVSIQILLTLPQPIFYLPNAHCWLYPRD